MVESVRHAQAAQDWDLAIQVRQGAAGSSPELTDPLTDSEARVLRHLPTNLSSPEIARQLSVSVNTVRTHMRHVYEKLGAHRRAGAVERARALGLLATAAVPASPG